MNKIRHYKILGFKYSKVNEVSIMTFFSFCVFRKVGKTLELFGKVVIEQQ